MFHSLPSHLIACALLLSFDLVLVLLDSPEKAWDIKMSTFILQQAIKEGAAGSRSPTNPVTTGSADNGLSWDISALKRYIALVKERFRPKLSVEAQLVLVRYYQQQRQQVERTYSRTTVRLLESLVRLSEAHAKLMFREEVTLQDAVVAIRCCSTQLMPLY